MGVYRCVRCGHVHEIDLEPLAGFTCWVCGTTQEARHESTDEWARPAAARPHVAMPDDGLPSWFDGLRYLAESDEIELDLSSGAAMLTLTSTPEQIEQLVDELTKCLAASKRRRQMIDLPTS